MVEHDDMLDERMAERMAETENNKDAPKSGQSDPISQWTVRELTISNIEEIAEQLGISMERINEDVISDIVHSVRKGVDAALENWGQIIEEAILNAGRKKDT